MVIFQVRDDSDLEQGNGCAGGVKNRKQMFGKINQVIFFCKNGLDMGDEGERSKLIRAVHEFSACYNSGIVDQDGNITNFFLHLN